MSICIKIIVQLQQTLKIIDLLKDIFIYYHYLKSSINFLSNKKFKNSKSQTPTKRNKKHMEQNSWDRFVSPDPVTRDTNRRTFEENRPCSIGSVFFFWTSFVKGPFSQRHALYAQPLPLFSFFYCFCSVRCCASLLSGLFF